MNQQEYMYISNQLSYFTKGITAEIIAKNIGSDCESVNHIINDMQRNGIVQIHGENIIQLMKY